MDILKLCTKSVDKCVNNVDNFMEKIIYLVLSTCKICINNPLFTYKQIFSYRRSKFILALLVIFRDNISMNKFMEAKKHGNKTSVSNDCFR